MGADQVLALLLAWLATAAIHGVLLFAAAWLLAAALARCIGDRASLAAARESLWKLAIFGGIVTASLTAAGAGSWRLHLGTPAPRVAEIAADPVSTELPVLAVLAREPAAAPSPIEASGTLPRASIEFPATWIELVAALWFLGVAWGAASWWRDGLRLRREVRGRRRIESGPAFDVLASLRRRSATKHDVRLSRAPGLAAPITLGILRPEICLPPRAEKELMPEELEAMLAHELAHARRRDPLLLALCRAVEVVFFFQPLVRRARVQLLDEAEFICDAHAARWTGDPASLASCLAEVATWIVGSRRGMPALSMAARGTRLALRVRSLLEPGDGKRKGLGGWVVFAATLSLAAIPLATPAISMDENRMSGPMSGLEPRPPSDPMPDPTLDLAPGTPEEREDVESASSESTESSVDSVSLDLARLELDSGAQDLQTILATLEAEFATITSDPGLEEAPPELRERVARMEERFRSLREMHARLENLIAEEVSAESR